MTDSNAIDRWVRLLKDYGCEYLPWRLRPEEGIGAHAPTTGSFNHQHLTPSDFAQALARLAQRGLAGGPINVVRRTVDYELTRLGVPFTERSTVAVLLQRGML